MRLHFVPSCNIICLHLCTQQGTQSHVKLKIKLHSFLIPCIYDFIKKEADYSHNSMPFLQLIRSASVHPSNYVVSDQNLSRGLSEEEAFTANKYRKEICWLILSLISVTIHLFLGMVVFETLTRQRERSANISPKNVACMHSKKSGEFATKLYIGILIIFILYQNRVFVNHI